MGSLEYGKLEMIYQGPMAVDGRRQRCLEDRRVHVSLASSACYGGASAGTSSKEAIMRRFMLGFELRPWSPMKTGLFCVLALLMVYPTFARAEWIDDWRLTENPHTSYMSANNARTVAYDDSGHLHVVWYEYLSGHWDIFYRNLTKLALFGVSLAHKIFRSLPKYWRKKIGTAIIFHQNRLLRYKLRLRSRHTQ